VKEIEDFRLPIADCRWKTTTPVLSVVCKSPLKEQIGNRKLAIGNN
jgi:hypothetical protein